MATKQIIAQEVDYIHVRFYNSRAYGYEGQPFACVTIDGKDYRNCCYGNDGVVEGIVEWLSEEIRNNEAAQAVLKNVYEKNESYTGASAIRRSDDGQYSIYNAGENAIFQLLRQLGVSLTSEHSSSRKNAYLVGYKIKNNGIEVETAA